MEAMATDMVRCIKTAKFNKQNVKCYRSSSKRLYDDEITLKKFLALSEDQKAECQWEYSPVSEKILHELSLVWKIDVTKYYEH